MYNDMNEIATWRPNVVRVAPGASGKKLRKDIEQVSLDRLVQQKFDDANKDRERAKVAELQAEIESGPPRDVPIAQKPQPLNRKMVKQSILASADIICTTLSTSGRGMFRKVKFETVIIDEAGQAVELSLLIPLKYDCKRFIMVGDPQQLPATVISQVAMSYQYEQSLFARMMKCGYPSLTLTTQYRMHPMIREFPSKHFYDDQLIDGVDEVTRARPWHSLGKSFAPFVFFDIQQGHQLIGTHQSFVNPTEAEFVTGMFQLLQSKFPDINDVRGLVTRWKIRA
jgi:senataxin